MSNPGLPQVEAPAGSENGRASAPTEPNLRAKALTLRDKVKTLRLPTEVNAQRPRGGSKLPWSLCSVFGFSTLVLSLMLGTTEHPTEKGKAVGPIAVPVETANPIASAGDAVLESKGYIVPVHQIQVSPKVGGMVLKLSIEEGQRVDKDFVLAQLETVDYLADRDRTKAQLENARQRHAELKNGSRPEEIKQGQAELEEAEATLKQLRLDFERNQRLRNDALSRRDYELAEFAFKAAERKVEQKRQMLKMLVEGPRKEKVDAADAEVKQWEAELAKAEWKLDNCTVRAPIKGIILTKKAEEGNIVNPSAFSNGLSASLCEMADLTDLEVDLKIQERDVAKVFKGQRCKVRAEAFPERVYEGVVSRLMPIADRSQAAVPVRVKIAGLEKEEGVYLKPEMGAIVSFQKK
jgi:multidrug resistance efflux pump